MWRALVLLFVLGCGGDDDPGGEITPCGSEATVHEGEGTYYDADGSGNCSFEPSPGDLLVAAMNTTDYAGSAVCGACIEATGPRGTVTVRIVDRCPGCAPGDVDFSEQAFGRIADIAAGRVPISWRVVPCQVSGPIRYHFKDGSNPFWVAIQVRNHRHAIHGVEARSGADWRALPREPYNYFVAEGGLGDGPLGFRVTDAHGHVLEDDGIPLGDAVEAAGGEQFPACE